MEVVEEEGEPQVRSVVEKRPKEEGAAKEEDEVTVNASIPGTVVQIAKRVGERVQEGDVLMVLEAMKMEIEVPATATGVIKEIAVKSGDSVAEGQLLAKIG